MRVGSAGQRIAWVLHRAATPRITARSTQSDNEQHPGRPPPTHAASAGADDPLGDALGERVARTVGGACLDDPVGVEQERVIALEEFAAQIRKSIAAPVMPALGV